MQVDSHTIITQALEQYGGRQKLSGDHIMVCCPFHEDGSPSCGVFLGEGLDIPLGVFHCFGCGTRGPWNRFAEKTGLPKIKEWANYATKIAYKDLDIPIRSLEQLVKSIRAQHTEWPEGLEWRGYSGKLVKRAGGVLINDVKNNALMLLFPVEVNGRLRGGIKAYLEKPAFGPSYISTKGGWVKKYGLFPYAQVKRMMKARELDSLALVEGPRDALRLIANGIPALAVLGAQNFDKEKALMVAGLLPARVFAVPDTDAAGVTLGENVVRYMRRYCESRVISLGDGSKKIDPDSASDGAIRKIKQIVCG